MSQCINKSYRAASITVCVCKLCYSDIEITELKNFRAGLGTKFSFQCTNPGCQLSEETCFSSEKSGKVFDVNRTSVLASRIAGKGR